MIVPNPNRGIEAWLFTRSPFAQTPNGSAHTVLHSLSDLNHGDSHRETLLASPANLPLLGQSRTVTGKVQYTEADYLYTATTSAWTTRHFLLLRDWFRRTAHGHYSSSHTQEIRLETIGTHSYDISQYVLRSLMLPSWCIETSCSVPNRPRRLIQGYEDE